MKNKLIILLTIIAVFANLEVCSSQVLKIKNGITFSKMSGDPVDILNKQVTLYTGFIGLDYWEHDYFYLSSEIGYLRKGGKEYISLPGLDEENPFFPLSNRYLKANIDYLQLNTTFRVKYLFDNVNLFAGLGPKIDILLRNKMNYENGPIDYFGTYNLNGNIRPISLGLKPEIGFYFDINRIRIEGNLVYYINFGRLDNIEGNKNKVGNKSISALLSVGYRLP